MRLWQRRYASNSAAVGMPLTYEGKASPWSNCTTRLQLDGDVDVSRRLDKASNRA